jgi:hypothetical protein
VSRRLFVHKATVKRNQAVGTNGRSQKATVATDVSCTFIPMTTRTEVENGFSVGVGYDVYFPLSADVRAGDQLEWDGGKFNVRGVRTYSVPRIGHRHVLATREGQ